MAEIFKIKKTPIITAELEDKEYPFFIKDFINEFKDKYDLSIFYNNIKDIELIPIDFNLMENKYATGEYDIFSNRIHYDPNMVRDAIMHELLHIATRIRLKDGAIAGFMQVNEEEYGIGIGLNEGYTALMDDRYFIDYSDNKRTDANHVYPTSKYICTILEYLLGKEHMEDLFMHSDLHTLFEELSQYSSPKRTYNFIINFDKLSLESDCKMHPNILKVRKYYEYIIMYLAECFITKFQIMYSNKELSKEEYEQCLGFVRYFMDQNLNIHKISLTRKLSKYINPLEDKVINKLNKSRVK